MAAPLIYRQVMQAACATCGAEWFGQGGEAAARSHAREIRHQVHIQILQKETLNQVAEGAEANYAPQVQLSTEELKLSVASAQERVSLFEGNLGRSGPGHPRSQQVAR